MVKILVKFANNPKRIVYSGQNLSGEVEIENKSSKSIQGIRLKIEGFAEVCITFSLIIQLNGPCSSF